jgi:hypothetical protein
LVFILFYLTSQNVWIIHGPIPTIVIRPIKVHMTNIHICEVSDINATQITDCNRANNLTQPEAVYQQPSELNKRNNRQHLYYLKPHETIC